MAKRIRVFSELYDVLKKMKLPSVTGRGDP
jgi:hypothetical protein